MEQRRVCRDGDYSVTRHVPQGSKGQKAGLRAPRPRRAADVLSRRLFGAIFYYDTIRAKRKDGEDTTTAIQLAHAGMRDLRRAAYHAPFRETRPPPDYDGIGVVEALPSQLTDIPRGEY